MNRVNFHLTESQIALLRELSRKTGLTVAEIIRRAIDDYLARAAAMPTQIGTARIG